jgi:glyoxylase-like metal-dependent hydrolase (beta-lactamase superfamily II)
MAANKLRILDCGSMSCDLTWLLLKPGRTIRPKAERDKPPEWYPCTTHAVVVDHAGNASMFAGAGPRMICNDKEKEFAFGIEGEFQGAHLKVDYEGVDWETVSGDTEFLPGVTLIEAPGHTPGTMAMKVDLPDTGSMIFTSDAIYMGDSYGPPVMAAAIVNDLGDFYASVEKIRSIAEQSDAMVVFGHDAEQLWSLRRAPDGAYT